MKLKMYLTAFLAMSMAVGCNRDDLVNGGDNGGNGINPADGVYISVSVQLPDGGPSTKSHTVEPGDASNDETEVGKDYENTVSRMLVVLARNSDNGYITAGTVDNEKDGSLETVQGSVHAMAKISKTTLANYYGNDGKLDPSVLGGEDKVNVFVVCNYTDELIEYFKFDENGISGLGKYETDWINQVCSVTEDNGSNTNDKVSVWQKRNMLMTNASIATKKLPLNLKDWDDFTSSAKPFNLSGANATVTGEMIDNDGSIRVERSVARFDFKDGSELKGNRYNVVYVKEDGNTTNYVDIVLNRMALVNMSNKFYYFRRVTNAENPSEIKVGYPELPWLEGKDGNYVVDVDYDKKEPGTAHFNFPLFTEDNKTIDEKARGQWYTSKISEVLGVDKESDEYVNGTNNKSYKIWRYVTENTVNNTNNMVNGLSTGIIFKGKMEPTDYLKNPTGEKLNEKNKKDLKKLAFVLGYGKGDCSKENLGLEDVDLEDISLNKNTNTDPILYTWGGMLYLRWPSIREAAIADAKVEGTETYDQSRKFYQAVFGSGSHTDNEGQGSSDETSPDHLWYKWQKSKSDTDLLEFKKAATSEKSGITLYQSSGDPKNDNADADWGYYCYYYYWNQHNNNDNPGVMGEMEFTVVRNNVYKLAVTKIDRLGHPRLSENDPDPVDPDDPDEKGDVYITLSVEVLPWVVRVNNIEF